MSRAYIYPNGGGFLLDVVPPRPEAGRLQFDTLKDAGGRAERLGLPAVHGWPPQSEGQR